MGSQRVGHDWATFTFTSLVLFIKLQNPGEKDKYLYWYSIIDLKRKHLIHKTLFISPGVSFLHKWLFSENRTYCGKYFSSTMMKRPGVMLYYLNANTGPPFKCCVILSKALSLFEPLFTPINRNTKAWCFSELLWVVSQTMEHVLHETHGAAPHSLYAFSALWRIHICISNLSFSETGFSEARICLIWLYIPRKSMEPTTEQNLTHEYMKWWIKLKTKVREMF